VNNMRLSFDSIEEVKDFVKNLKGTRGGKAEADEPGETKAPTPLAPPASAASGFPGAAGFAPPAPGAGPTGGAFPVAGAPQVAPEVLALVNRIVPKMDSAVSSGATKVGDMLAWFQGQCGPEAANATIDQIKQIFLPRMSVAQLTTIAGLMSA
jgi:hypothetical protein